jgi:glucose/mannose-6-phosphate isomerase
MDKMKPLIEGFTDQLRDALKIGQAAEIKPAKKEIRHVVIAGMGGSGIGGSLVASLIQDELKVPVVVIKTYDIPAFINEHTLFVASSFSGNTEETLESLQKALNTGAQCVAITSGGKIGEIARENSMETLEIPGDSDSPRANIGYSVVQLLFMLHYKGLIGAGFVNQFENLISLLDQEKENILARAEKLGNGIKGYLPIFYADNRIHPVAVRIQQQLNENGKHLAHTNSFPEMNHNELVGWEHPEQILADSKVYFLKTDYDHPRVRERFKISNEIFSSKAVSIIEIEAKGQSLLEQCFYLIHLTDWVSYFLAKANDADPFTIDAIDHLKGALAKA